MLLFRGLLKPEESVAGLFMTPSWWPLLIHGGKPDQANGLVGIPRIEIAKQANHYQWPAASFECKL